VFTQQRGVFVVAPFHAEFGYGPPADQAQGAQDAVTGSIGVSKMIVWQLRREDLGGDRRDVGRQVKVLESGMAASLRSSEWLARFDP
jgi:hypothetical protein